MCLDLCLCLTDKWLVTHLSSTHLSPSSRSCPRLTSSPTWVRSCNGPGSCSLGTCEYASMHATLILFWIAVCVQPGHRAMGGHAKLRPYSMGRQWGWIEDGIDRSWIWCRHFFGFRSCCLSTLSVSPAPYDVSCGVEYLAVRSRCPSSLL